MPYMPLIPLFNRMDPLRRPPLRNLKISNFKIKEGELVKFLRRFLATLRTVHFSNLLLTTGSRQNVFRMIENEMNLTSAIFHGFHQWSDSRDIDEDYDLYQF